jgi:integrase
VRLAADSLLEIDHGVCTQTAAWPAFALNTPHSLRATTATMPLDAGVDIWKVQDLLGHRLITTTQIYDKRRRSTAESASHDSQIERVPSS